MKTFAEFISWIKNTPTALTKQALGTIWAVIFFIVFLIKSLVFAFLGVVVFPVAVLFAIFWNSKFRPRF